MKRVVDRALDHSRAYRERGRVRYLRATFWEDQQRPFRAVYELAVALLPLTYALGVALGVAIVVLAAMVYDLAASLARTVKGRAVKRVGRTGEEDGLEVESVPESDDLR